MSARPLNKAMLQRIGHGVDAMQESDPEALLRMMAHENVLVEICLTSNDVILNVTGDHHPLPDVSEVWRAGCACHG